MKQHDSKAEQAVSSFASWWERLSSWLGQSRSPSEQGEKGAWADAVLGSASTPLTTGALESMKRSYLYRLREQLGAVHAYGLDDRRRTARESGQQLDLGALYRPLNTTIEFCVEPDKSSTLASGAPRMRRVPLLEAVGKHRKVIIHGEHGTGKSTFLRFLALSLAEQSPQGEHAGLLRLGAQWEHGWLFPLWVDLRGLKDSSFDDGTAVGLCTYVASDLGIEAAQLCTQIISPGGVLLLLDGLESAPASVADFVDGIDALASLAPQGRPNCVVIASLAYAARERIAHERLADYSSISLAPWDIEQMDGYVRAWYTELRRKEWVSEDQAHDLTGQLCAALRRDEVRVLAQRPALMAIVALLHVQTERLPEDRGVFYRRLIDLIVSAWLEGSAVDAHDLRQAFVPEVLRMTLAQLAYQGISNLEDSTDLVSFSERDLRAALANARPDERWESVNELVARVGARPLFLEEQAPGVYSFAAPDLLAYLAAYHLSVQPELARLVVRLVDEDMGRWFQVIIHTVSQVAGMGEGLSSGLVLLDALLEPSAVRGEEELGAAAWQMARLAGEALVHLMQSFDLGLASLTVNRTRERLSLLLQRGALDPRARAEAGRVLDRLPGGDPRPGLTSDGPLWCEVPDCAFWYGEDSSTLLAGADPFWIARYQVTNVQYMAFVRATGRSPPSHWRGNAPPIGLGNHPVVCVTWQDAVAYCVWWTARQRDRALSVWRGGKPTGAPAVPQTWEMRLPTGAEWEKAARGGLLVPSPSGDSLVENTLPRRRYPWGDSWTLSRGEAKGDETRCNVSESNLGATTPVGMYPRGASPYGVMDMAGNVWEWCLDWADKEGRYKVRRGGAFRYGHDQARCSASDRAHPDLAWPYVGFRPVLGPTVAGAEGRT